MRAQHQVDEEPLHRAVLESLRLGQVPAPEILCVASDEQHVDNEFVVGSNRLMLLGEGLSRLELKDPTDDYTVQLTLNAVNDNRRRGIREKGFGTYAEISSRTNLVALSGCLRVGKDNHEMIDGFGWIEDSFVSPRDGAPTTHWGPLVDYDWARLLFEDGTWVSIQLVNGGSDGASVTALVCSPSVGTQAYSNVDFVAQCPWISPRTFMSYPTAWTIDIRDIGLRLSLASILRAQEAVCIAGRHPFWVGAVSVTGSRDGKPIAAVGIVRVRRDSKVSLTHAFSNVRAQTANSCAHVLPLSLTVSDIQSIGLMDPYPSGADGVSLDIVARTICQPIRAIVDRGGKAWRSFAIAACCDVVGGTWDRIPHLLATPELTHAGALIVDDVEDQSQRRRNGPACHVIFGQDVAINAGSMAYFVMQRHVLESDAIDDDTRLAIYRLYVASLRAAHLGQALDIGGLSFELRSAAQSGDASVLEQRIGAMHRLKSGIPAATAARMGALIGGGNHQQTEALGNYFEVLGCAFQIIDDVADFRGRTLDTKALFEDIGNGKVTLPIAIGMRVLGIRKRELIADVIEDPNSTDKDAGRVKNILEECGALDECIDRSRRNIEAAWENLVRVVPVSLARCHLRCIGWYLVENYALDSVTSE